MLNASDLQKVKDYVFEGFPELRPRVAIRRFNPPAWAGGNPDVRENMLYRDWLVSHKKMVRDDLLAQLPWTLQTSAKLAFHNAASPNIWSYWKDKYDFLESCLSQTPYAFPIKSFSANRKALQSNAQLFYVAQLSDAMSDEVFFDWMFMRQNIGHLPGDTRRIIEIMMVTHELGHTLPGNFLPPVTFFSQMYNQQGQLRKLECVCDVLGVAAVLAIVGERAIPVLEMFANSRDKSSEKKIEHYTAPALRKAIEADSPLRNKIPVEIAFNYAKHLYQTLEF